MMTIIFALLAMQTAQQPEPVPPQSVKVASLTTTPETPQQAAERRRLDRLEIICSRRAPTGSRLDRTQCEPRDRIELQARAKRQETEDFINMSGMVTPLD